MRYPYLFRSWRYLKPYKGRITVSVICVICIACLWGGGIGMVLPGAKILLSPEGLHGWAYKELTQDHLGLTVAAQDIGDSAQLSKQGVETVWTVASVDKKGPAWAASIRAKDWIVGVGERTMRKDQTLRLLGQAEVGSTMAVRVLPYGATECRTVPVTAGTERWQSEILKRVAMAVPEPKNDSDRFPLFAALLGFVVVLTVIRAVFTFIQEYFVGTAIWLGIMDLRCDNYNRVLHLPTTFFSEKGVSDASSRFVQDTNELARGQNTLLGKTMVEPAKAVSLLVLALFLSWQLTLVAMLAGPPAFWMINRFGKKMHKAAKKALESWSLLLAVLAETLIGIRVVKAYTMEGVERRRFFRVNRQLLKQQMKKELLDALTGPTVECLGIVAGMVAAAGAGYWVFVGFHWKGQTNFMDKELFLAWIAALFGLMDPVRKLAKVTMRFSESDAAAKRIFDLQEQPEEPSVHNAPTLPRHSQSVVFEDVSFHYPNAAVDAVRHVTLNIRAGQNVAIVGANGSGKTTLLSMLPRLLDPTSGRILIDGQDISQYSLRSLRRQIGLVTQDNVMFHATVAENIAYGLHRAKREQVVAAAQKAFVDEFVTPMPLGYETMVGEYGSTLSGGQRQRIAIARAILRDPAILIFDEAMSQVDSDSEHRINQAMAGFVKGRTTLVIAHRFATVLSSDLIVVMDAGAIVDSGTHKELLERCSIYKLLYRTQFLDSGGEGDSQGA